MQCQKQLKNKEKRLLYATDCYIVFCENANLFNNKPCTEHKLNIYGNNNEDVMMMRNIFDHFPRKIFPKCVSMNQIK